MRDSRPRLVIVGGAPGTGKTTLARALASRMNLALVAKDDVKEAIADVLGVGDRERSRELGAAAYAVMRAIAASTLRAGVGLILEANFDERSRPWLGELARVADRRVVLCRADPELRRRRFAGRERHAVHLDDVILEHEWRDEREYALDLGAPRLVVDTTDGYRPPLDEVVRFAAVA
jgi:predicted kinase